MRYLQLQSMFYMFYNNVCLSRGQSKATPTPKNIPHSFLWQCLSVYPTNQLNIQISEAQG